MNRNAPSLPVTLVRVPCMEELDASTVTPGSGRPSVPLTFPWISPVVCPKTTGAIRRRQADSARLNRKTFIPILLLLETSSKAVSFLTSPRNTKQCHCQDLPRNCRTLTNWPAVRKGKNRDERPLYEYQRDGSKSGFLNNRLLS